MVWRGRMKRWLTVLPPLWLWLSAATETAHARNLRCSFDLSNINFGTINVLTGAAYSATGTLEISCRGNPFENITICPNIGSGSGNPVGHDPRQLQKWGTNSLKLNFNLFWPSGGNIWGSQVWPFPPRPPIFHLRLDASGRLSASYAVPAAIFGGQYFTWPGVYYSLFSNGHVLFQYKRGTHADCSTPDGQRRPRFRVRARVAKACEVSATDLDFGAVGALNANVDATASITMRCTMGTPYKIRINGGHTGTTNPANRKMTNGAFDITYGIYRDAARTQGWGRWNSNDVNATGNGLPQTFTAYGRVPPQPTPPPGGYTDTLVVSVVY